MAGIDTSDSIVQGKNWGVFGKMNTGKTYTSLMLAFALSAEFNRRVIVLDHSDNQSYDAINTIIPVERLQYNLDEFGSDPLKVRMLTRDKDAEFNNFCHFCMQNVRNSIIVIDDSGVFFKGGFEKIREMFIKSSKNTYNDVFFQAHSFREVGPGLLDNLQVFVIKELTSDNMPNKIPDQHIIEKLHNEVIADNMRRPRNKRWSYRIFDSHEGIIFKENKKNTLVAYDSIHYFNKK